VKIARSFTGRQAVVVFDHAFHGRTLLTMSLTAKAMPYKSASGHLRRRSTVSHSATPTAAAADNRLSGAETRVRIWLSPRWTSRSAETGSRVCSSNPCRVKVV